MFLQFKKTLLISILLKYRNHDVGANDVFHNRDSLQFDISMIFFILDSNHDNIYEVLEI